MGDTGRGLNTMLVPILSLSLYELCVYWANRQKLLERIASILIQLIACLDFQEPFLKAPY